jgi:restriction system protein
MKSYYRIMLGPKSVHADVCFKGNFIGTDFLNYVDLTNRLADNWRDFNAEFIPYWLKDHPGKSKIPAGLACGALWTVSKGVAVGDIVLCPNGTGSYYIGEVLDTYSYHPGQVLPHRRTVRWFSNLLERSAMSEGLKNSAGAFNTVTDMTKHAEEIERLIGGNQQPRIVTTDPTIEDPAIFALEKHLEDFLVQNWKQTELGKNYDIYEEDGELVGQQYQSDTGPIDILAIRKDKKELLVVELKKGRVSDSVVGQVQRYMGYVQQELAEEGQKVSGVIIALDDDIRIRRALAVAPNIDFFKYQVSFKLFKS